MSLGLQYSAAGITQQGHDNEMINIISTMLLKCSNGFNRNQFVNNLLNYSHCYICYRHNKFSDMNNYLPKDFLYNKVTNERLTWSLPRPCSRMFRAIRWACSLVASRLMLYAMRNFRAPTMVAPQLGTNSLGPKSGFHSGF